MFMITNIIKILFLTSLSLRTLYAADLPRLRDLFIENYDNYYEPRYCGRNIARFVKEATKQNIDLTNSYILKIVGAGFLETSGFYTREGVDQRKMLGYFHVVFVVDNHVIDFDLNRPVILKLEEYIRLQFTPPYESFNIWGINYKSKEQLSSWTVIGFAWIDYIQNKEGELWRMNFSEFINLDQMLEIDRTQL